MPQHHGSNRARYEQELRRKAFQNRMRLQANSSNKSYYSDESVFNWGFSEYNVRKFAPYALVVHSMTILLFITWIVSSITYDLGRISTTLNDTSLGAFYVPKGGAIYSFRSVQTFSGKVPEYSELEIEILDKNYQHVYSVFKDLWSERHPNGEGGKSIYSDKTLEYEVILPHEGNYFMRAISHNDNLGTVSTTISRRLMGGIYAGYYLCAFGILSLLLLLSNQAIGTPVMMVRAMKKVRSLKDNMGFMRFLIICSIIFIGIWVIGITQYGYAAGGSETVLPTYFYSKNSVIYLG